MKNSQKVDKSVSFVCSIPPCARAVDFHGEGGTRLLLDIPESDKPAALELPAYFLGKPLDCVLTIRRS